MLPLPGSGAGGVGAALHHTAGGALVLPPPVLLGGAPHHSPLLNLHDHCARRPQPAVHVQQKVGGWAILCVELRLGGCLLVGKWRSVCQ